MNFKIFVAQSKKEGHMIKKTSESRLYTKAERNKTSSRQLCTLASAWRKLFVGFSSTYTNQEVLNEKSSTYSTEMDCSHLIQHGHTQSIHDATDQQHA